jgi:sugar lactone lactonase YvrE
MKRKQLRYIIIKIFSCFIVPLHSINNISFNAKWIQNGTTVAGSDIHGNGLNEFLYPEAIYVDEDQTIYIADSGNHRIVEWKRGAKNGSVVAGGNGKGNRSDQLDGPTYVILDKETNSIIVCDVGNTRVVRWSRRNGTSGQTIIPNVVCFGLAMDEEGYLYVSDYQKHEVRRWRVGTTSETVVAGGNGQGNGLNQLSSPTAIFVDQNHSVYISEKQNCRVTKWMKGVKAGIVVAGGQDKGSGLTQLSSPRGLMVDQLNTIYVADTGNSRIMRWFEGATQGSIVVDGNSAEEELNQHFEPIGLSFDQQGNLYVSDKNKHQVQRFDINLN